MTDLPVRNVLDFVEGPEREKIGKLASLMSAAANDDQAGSDSYFLSEHGLVVHMHTWRAQPLRDVGYEGFVSFYSTEGQYLGSVSKSVGNMGSLLIRLNEDLIHGDAYPLSDRPAFLETPPQNTLPQPRLPARRLGM